MKIFITLVMMLAVSGVSYAGPAASDLGVSAGVKNISDTAFQAPSAPVAVPAETADGAFEKGLSNAFCQAHPMTPGCPGYCKVSPAYPGCPLFCKDHHGHPACKGVTKGISDGSEADGDMKKVIPGYPKPPHPQWCSNHHGFPGCR